MSEIYGLSGLERENFKRNKSGVEEAIDRLFPIGSEGGSGERNWVEEAAHWLNRRATKEGMKFRVEENGDETVFFYGKAEAMNKVTFWKVTAGEPEEGKVGQFWYEVSGADYENNPWFKSIVEVMIVDMRVV